MALVNTDIYNIRQSLEDLKKSYIPEDNDTLSLGIFGYIGDLESKKIQTAIMMIGELENEVFPNRSKLTKNIISHAIMQNITDINATPAYITIILAINCEDLDRNMVNNKFIIDKDFKFIFTNESKGKDYEYHLDYDIILTQSKKSNNTLYAAVYDMDKKNTISTIDNPYLNQPYTVKMDNGEYVFIQCLLRQVQIKTKYKQITSNSTIDNKTMTFSFEDQLVDFEVRVRDNGNEYWLTPIFEGAAIENDIKYYCYYTYINTDTIRIKFDNSSYIPALNAEVDIIIKTTKGSEATFNHKDNIIISLKSDKYNYSSISAMVIPNTSSTGAVDRKSTEELQSIIPKEMLSRGSISTETDLYNYFNMVNTENNRLKIIKKIDNQIDRIYYTYFVMRNSDNNIVPTNTINIDIKDTDFANYGSENSILVLPAGTTIEYDPQTFVGKVVESSESEYVYTTLYTTIVNRDPLLCGFFMCIINDNKYLEFEKINQDANYQYIAQNIHFERKLLSEPNKYNLDFEVTQNIANNIFDVDLENKNINDCITILNDYIKAIIVLYKDEEPYRYKIASLIDYDKEISRFTFNFEFETDNKFDINNNIKINNLGVVKEESMNYGYMEDNTEAHIYILAKIDNGFENRYGFDSIVPGFEDFVITNIYKVNAGINFFINYSKLMNNKITVTANNTTCDKFMYTIDNVPVLAKSYINDEDKVSEFIEQINYKKIYIDNSLYVLENSFEIDFRFFNTYGPSRTYTIDSDGTNSIGRVDTKFKFRLSLKSSSDIYTKDAIINDIKNYIESLDDMEDLHIPNVTTYIEDKYSNTINYFEFCGFNNFDANYQHMYKNDNISDKNICPEFINLRNTVDVDGIIIPDIDIETVVN